MAKKTRRVKRRWRVMKDDDSGHRECLRCGLCMTCGDCLRYGCGQKPKETPGYKVA